MSKISKVILSFISVICMSIVTLPTISNAATWEDFYNKMKNDKVNINDKVTITMYTEQSKNDARPMYCLEYLEGTPKNTIFTVANIIDIVGKTSTGVGTDGKSLKIVNKSNAKLAYILSLKNSKGAVKRNHQEAIWDYLPTWRNNVGKNYKNINSGLINNNHPSVSNEVKKILNDADNYANTVNTELTYNDLTGEITSTKYNDTYTIIGPFKWEFTGKIDTSKIKIYSGDKEINDVKFGKLDSDKKWKSTSITSKTDFYMAIPTNSLTNKKLKVKVTSYTEVKASKVYFLKQTSGDGKQNIMAYVNRTQPLEKEWSILEYSIQGNLKIIKVDKDNNTVQLKGVGFIIKNSEEKYVHKDSEGNITYVAKDKATEFVTDKNGEITIKGLLVGTYTAYETKNPNEGYEIVKDGLSKNVVIDKTVTLKIENEYVYGNLKVIKVDQDNNEIRIPDVKFTIQNENGKYVALSDNKEVVYVDTKYEFKTDENGEIYIENLRKGKYTLHETEANKYYELNTEGKQTVIESRKTIEEVITNKRSVINLSGFVWEDMIASKADERNDLYKESTSEYDDNGDKLMEGVTVRLKDKNGNIVKNQDGQECVTKTDSKGEYLFENILILELENYHVEFEYNGLTYTNVKLITNKDNGSKAAEFESTRNNFNAQFAEVTGPENSDRNSGYTSNTDGNRTHNLTYKIADHVATLESISGDTSITAQTASTYIKDRYDELVKANQEGIVEEITFVNLGLYQRAQPDIALIKDLQNVKLSINGYSHVYNYAQRFTNAGEYGDGFNVGVKFGEKYGNMSYSRAVYKADCNYTSDDKSKELKVDVTYRIAIRNESTSLITRVNSIVDYFDNNYAIQAVGTELDENGNVVGSISHNESAYNSDYTKCVINTNAVINSQQNSNVYVQFTLNREAVLKILNDGENLDNVVEINSYSVFDKNEKIYAGIDRDSNPGNCVPGDKSTYEDDTDQAPALQLELSNESLRKILGTVFEDSADETKLQSRIREGDGIYKTEQNEHGIKDVTVTLKDANGNVAKIYDVNGETWKEAIVRTDDSGNFAIEGFIPDRYTLEYNWGGQTYTDSNGNITTYDVNNYKGTIYDESKHSGETWWNSDDSTRYSDAKDSWKLRQEIDNGTNTDGKMNSSTTIMDFGIEEGDIKGKVTTTETIVDGDRFITGTYEIANIDYGIIERPRQELNIGKRVSHIKLTLANGQVLTDADVSEDGKLTGTVNKLTYQHPSGGEDEYQYGSIWQQADNEIIQGANLEVTYEITVKNNSEYDYANENFYHYGSSSGDTSNPVKIQPTGVNDYLDEEFDYDESTNGDWTIVGESSSESESSSSSTNTTPEGEWEQVGEPIITEDGSTVIRYKKHLGTTETTTQGIIENKYVIQSKKKEELSGETILELKDAASKIGELEAGQTSQPIQLKTSKVLSSTGDIVLENKAEITEIETKGGRYPTFSRTLLYDEAEKIIVTPNTGDDKNYIIPIILGTSLLVIMGAGVVLIKKKVLNK